MYISPSFYPAVIYGGPIYSAACTCSNLVSLDVNLHIYTTDVNQTNRLNIEDAKLSCKKDYNLLNVNFYRELVTNKFSIGHLWNVFINARKFDILHSQSIFSMCTPVAIFSSLLFRKPIVISPRGSLGEWCIENGSKLKNIWLKTLIRPFSKRINWHVTAEQEMREVKNVMPNACKFIIIPNGIHMFKGKAWSKDKLLRSLSLPLSAKYILSMGRIEEKKGFDYTIEAFHSLKANDKLYLLIAGSDYGYLDKLQALSLKLNIESRVKFIGMIDGEQKASLFKYAELFSLNSRNENFGNVYTEALSFDTPIIASVNTPWHFIDEAGAGFCTPNDASSISDAMNKILLDRESYSVNCKDVVENFTWSTIGHKFKESYQEIINNA